MLQGAVDGREPALPERIGRYRIVRELGRGGMGVVYEAEQDLPRRTVALKLVTTGLLSREVLQRFSLEAEVLGRLQHPGIAQIYDAGQVDASDGSAGGRPYFAMELIRGEPLTDYAERARLGTRARLELLALVCDAVHHAHQRGVIHRDLKPANILVDAAGQPKVLDFGVARATDSDLRTATLATTVGQLVGTIPYMSPEQASGDPARLDARSDLYSLGVVAYELVSGRMPYELDPVDMLEALRVVREREARPLSSHDQRLRGDVETLIGKALEKEPDRRYSSTAAFAEDIRRHLAHQPLVARPPSTFYQVAKFTRRNKVLVSGIVAVLLALVAGLTGTSLGYVEAGRQRDEATAARNAALAAATQARQTSDFLRAILAGIDPSQARGEDTTLLRRVLDDAAQRLESELADLPLVEAEVRQTIGQTYAAISLHATAEPHLRRAFEVYRSELGAADARSLEAQGQLGNALRRMGRFAQADGVLREAAQLARGGFGATDPLRVDLDKLVALVLYDTHRLDEAKAALEDVIGRMEASPTAGVRRVIGAGVAYSTLLLQMGRDEEAERFLDTLVARADAELGETDQLSIEAQFNRAALDQKRGRPQLAEPRFRELYERCRRSYGGEHSVTQSSLRCLAHCAADQGRWSEAEQLYAGVIEFDAQRYGRDHFETLGVRKDLAQCWVKQGRYGEAEAALREVLAGFERALGPEHREVAGARLDLGQLLRIAGRPREGEIVLREAIAAVERDATADPRELLSLRVELAICLTAMARLDEAEVLERAVLAARLEHDGPDHPDTLIARTTLAMTLTDLLRFDEADQQLALSLEGHLRTRGDDHPQTLIVLHNAGVLCERRKRPEQALAYFAEAAEGWEERGEPEHPTAVTIREKLFETFEAHDFPAQEEPWRRRELERARERLAPGDPRLAVPLGELAYTLVRQERGAEAIELLEEAIGLESALAAGDPNAAWTQTLYGAALLSAGRPEEAAEWLEDAEQLLGVSTPRRIRQTRAWVARLGEESEAR